LQNTPLHPIAEWGRQRFGGADVPVERRLADLDSSLQRVKLDPGKNAPLLAPLVDIPLSPERLLQVAPDEFRRRQLAALHNWIVASARVQPVVLAIEDLHWADPTTIDVLKGIAERGALAPLFVVATTRPEFKPPWGSRSHHGTISLVPLDRSQVRHMVGEIAARHALRQDVIDGVAERTGGVPLFIEEVTRLLLERGEQAFRNAETNCLISLLNEPPALVSTGGGCVMNPVNCQIMRNHGLIILIDRPPEDIMQDIRLETRPLLQEKGAQEVPKIYADRIEWYRKAADAVLDNAYGYHNAVYMLEKMIVSRFNLNHR
jgi:shikimate kinase